MTGRTVLTSAMGATLAALSLLLAVPLAAQSIDRLEAKNVRIAQTNFKGRSAIQVIAAPEALNAASYAVVKDVSFRDGTIEVDLEPGIWTKYKIEVEGRKARLYVHGAEQPCLIVNDLKLEPRGGGVALFVGPGTEGYFAGLKITAK